MTTTPVMEWVDRLRVGTLDVSDLKTLEEVRLADILDGLLKLFPVQFLNRKQRGKWEVGLAQVHRHNRPAAVARSSKTPLRKRTAASHTLEHCLLLTSESDHLTTLAAMNRLRVRTLRGKDEPVEFSSGAGFSLYRDPDGWKIKLLEERTIALSHKALHDRGWQLGMDEGMDSPKQ